MNVYVEIQVGVRDVWSNNLRRIKMGLDMYLFKKSKDVKQLILNNLSDEDDYEKIAYWRKDWLIHEWFCEYFEIENCEYVEISEEELLWLVEYLEEHIKECGEYGEESEVESEKYNKDSIKKLNKIVKEIDWENEKIYYYAWW